jgi:maleylpyruvate isomerase
VSTPDLRAIDRCVEACTAAHQKLLEIADGLTDAELRAPSLLPGWSRGHVLNHLRRNAIGFTGMCAAAQAGEVGMQYPGGAEERSAGIEDGADDPAATLVGNLRESIYALEAAWFRGDGTMWMGSGVVAGGATINIHDIPFRRLREVVVHTTDLDVGYGYGEWPDLYVRLELERQKKTWAATHSLGLTQFPANVMALPEKQRLAWLIQRATVEGLPEGPGL